MSMNARSMSTSGTSAEPVLTHGAALPSKRTTTKATVSIRRRLAVATLMVLSALAAHVITLLDVTPRLQREGACIAMDMATAYGFIDEPKRKVVTRAISETGNPHAGRFTGGYRKLNDACADIAKNRWRGW
jgi:hypothetical protein